MYISTKTFPPISCAFRQWRAESHCRFIHGYALTFKVEFECEDLDVRHWCIDFGALKNLKLILDDAFDHKTLLAVDDPLLEEFRHLDDEGALDLHVVDATGCEKFAEYAYTLAAKWIKDAGHGDRCCVRSVEVWEHPANSARFEPT